VDIDLSIRHHWTGDRFKVHLFKHKGYWYHGRRREAETMRLFAELLGSGDCVVEIGAHIGYVSVYLARLIEPDGRLVVFEPAPENLRYLRTNATACQGVTIIGKAVSDRAGRATLHIEDLTGQNNSLLDRYHVLDENRQLAYTAAHTHAIDVECVTLDDCLRSEGLPKPSLIKIDVEGAEYRVLKGMSSTLKAERVALMVEVTENAPETMELLWDSGFETFLPNRTRVKEPRHVQGNVFCLKRGDDRVRLFAAA
jgi:FkbM family methyltransferase